MLTFLKKQISLNSGILLFIVGFSLSSILFFTNAFLTKPDKKAGAAIPTSSTKDCEITSFRSTGFQFTSPLLYVEKSCESPDFLMVKNDIQRMLAAFKASNDITTASVYLRDFEHSRWMGVNEHEVYHPGSLSKVPLLMAYLLQSESDPTLLGKEYLFEQSPAGTLPTPQYQAITIKTGKKYTVKELMRYMIVYSDNNATWLLSEKIGLKNYEKTFLNLGISIPILDTNDNTPRISTRDYSVFFRALYNASYLTASNSEYALSLLGGTVFAEGLVNGLPTGTKLVHKFAEWDNGLDFELHESGIFYSKGKAFLITVMTRGKQREKLPNVIASLTRSIYEQVAAP